MMGYPKKHFAAAGLMGWLFMIIFFLIFIRSIDLTIFLLLVSLGLFVLIEVLDTSFAKPSHIMYLKYWVAVGLVFFVTVIVDKVVRVVQA
ncbi:MAG: hypothetical protein PHU26_07875 [Methanofollis liminatans]|jgi:hypothetical protein|nr:hypothetical protein [Methanofollis liminatans]MDD3112194.1 hypothetical protein [Methanofollis liminatans]